MRRLAGLTFAVLTLALASDAAAQRWINGASPAHAKLTLPDTKVLPGVPFDLWIEVDNPSDSAVTVGLCSTLLVRPEQGTPFQISGSVPGDVGARAFPVLLPKNSLGGDAIWSLDLKPREKRTLTLPIQYLDGPVFFDDERLSKPGRYSLAMRLDYCWGDLVPQEAALPPTFFGPVTTNEVSLERVQPTGSDARVWEEMQRMSKGHWVSTTSGFDEGVMKKNADSNYVPYWLLRQAMPGAEWRDRARAAMRQFPDSPVLELLQLKSFDRTDPKEWTKLKQSLKRPTTRILAFGREDLGPPPCAEDEDC